jgi:hypothetical protein
MYFWPIIPHVYVPTQLLTGIFVSSHYPKTSKLQLWKKKFNKLEFTQRDPVFFSKFYFSNAKKRIFFAPNNSAKMKFMLKGQRFGCVCVKSRPKSG